MSDKIKNIIFDVGDVLVSFRYRDYMGDLGFDDETVEFLTKNMIFTDFWKGMDLGQEDVDEACDHFCARFPELKEKIELFWNNIEDIVGEYDYSLPLVQSMKAKGYKVFLLSNYPDKLADMHWKHFSFLPEVDGYIISAKVGLAKPDQKIYLMLMDRYRLKPEECIFIDDREDNLAPAEKLGLQTILFESYEDLIKKLEEAGVA
ncbi:MAG: HAD family phosphatase [Eubacterium sp.]|nr:HAD family phosphatase [Eubacterium sp.]